VLSWIIRCEVLIIISWLEIVLLSLGLSMDAFAVAVASGFILKQPKVRHAFKIAFFFGSFQAVMPVLGWMAGKGFQSLIAGVDHWIAFGLLSFIGSKMILEAFKPISKEEEIKPLNTWVLFMLAVATSIDALAVGVSFAFLKVLILKPVVAIGTITFTLSFLGVFIGKKVGHFLEHKVKILGGLILIGIGTKILIEHLIH
jgi:manganese efflux pump family protein